METIENTVNAFPTKRFFVSMLTRDIDLKDAILDLLDNCVDGVLRQIKNRNPSNTEEPYLGYWAKISATPEEFSIIDNCGGISKAIAQASAFRLGRADQKLDAEIATVGMYGIGMKRAIFKMGEFSRIDSYHVNDSYHVEITPNWLKDDNNWNLELVQDGVNHLEQNGTKILVQQLHENIKSQFNESESDFLSDLIIEVSNFYALIIKKGFKVFVNEKEIQPEPLDILMPNNFQSGTITPYIYDENIDNVDIKIIVGFYRKLASEKEIDDEKHISRSRDNAGWTVICNDRVVLYKDKTQITGWGDNNVPKYHNQFISIAGIAVFYSNEPLKLPINTTKRGIDMQSPIYWSVRKRMTEGLKKFTDFTNHWKGREEETNTKFEETFPKNINIAIASIPDNQWKPIRNSTGRIFVPDLPRPLQESTHRKIVFSRTIEEIEVLADFFYDDSKAPPSDIGNRCFDEALKIAKEKK
jgi:hypothetical protein